MAVTNTLIQLIELAQSTSDEAARKLAEAQRQHQQAEAKCRLLAGYWTEYQSRQRSIYRADATTMSNFHDFVGKLESTIASHTEDSKKILQRLDGARHEWELAQRRLKSLQKLVSRRTQEANKQSNRMQQKLQDEFVSQRAFHAASIAG